jgi:hypothetical protein
LTSGGRLETDFEGAAWAVSSRQPGWGASNRLEGGASEWGHFWDMRSPAKARSFEITRLFQLRAMASKAAVERREARRPDHKGRKDASPASSRASPARKVPRGTCVSRCSTPPRSSANRRREGKRKIKDYRAAAAAKQTAGGAMCCLTIWLAQPDFPTEGRARAGATLAPPHAEEHRQPALAGCR